MSGLDRDDVASSSSEVTCFSSHLTSFAILVDASGVTGVRCAVQRRCSASLCIALSIFFNHNLLQKWTLMKYILYLFISLCLNVCTYTMAAS